MAGMEMGDCWSSLVRGGDSLDRAGGGGSAQAEVGVFGSYT